MLIQKKHERETASDKGLAIRTIIQAIWFGISAVIAYFIFQYLFEVEILSYPFLYSHLLIPPWVPEWAVMAGLILLFILFTQFFLILGFFIFSPLGRVRPGWSNASWMNS